MATTTENLQTTILKRRRALQDLETNAEKAAELSRSVASMKQDIARFERRRQMFAEYGDGHIELPQESYDPRFSATIVWEPIRSKLTGNQLAAAAQANIVHLQAEIARADTRNRRAPGADMRSSAQPGRAGKPWVELRAEQ